MEEYRNKSRVFSDKQNEYKPREFSPKLHLPDINIQMLIQSSFKDKDSSTKFYDLFKKYNRDSQNESKLKIMSSQPN